MTEIYMISSIFCSVTLELQNVSWLTDSLLLKSSLVKVLKSSQKVNDFVSLSNILELFLLAFESIL